MRYFIFLLLMWQTVQSFAQVTHTLQPLPGQRVQVQDLWQLTITNPTGDQRPVYLEGELKLDDGTTVAVFQSAPLRLAMGVTRVNPLDVQVIRQQYQSEQARIVYARTQNFPEGDYRICVRVMLEEDRTMLSEDCREHRVINPYSPEDHVRERGLGRHFSFSGSGYVEGFYASEPNPFQQLPQQYMRTDINSTLSVSVLPFRMRFFHSTEQSLYMQNMNAASMEFDENQFKSNLRALVASRIEENDQLNMLTNLGDVQRLAELESLERLREDASLQDEFRQLEDRDQAAEELQRMDVSALVGRANTLRDEVRSSSQQLDYEVRRTSILSQLEFYESLQLEDEAERQRIRAIDSLQTELMTLEHRRDSIHQANEAKRAELSGLEQQMERFNQLRGRVERLQEIAAKKEQFDALMERREELTNFREQLEESGRLEELQQFDYASLQDPSVLRDKLREYNLFTGERRFFFGVNELAVGTVYPYYSPLVLSGIRIQGANVEMSPGIFHFAVTGGVSRNQMFLGEDLSGYRQRMIAGRVGIGKPYGSHLYFTALRALDDFSEESPTATFAGLRPQSNFIVGSDLRLQFFRQRLVVEGEVAASMHNNDERLEPLDLEEPGLSDAPAFLRPTIGSRYGIAYNLSTTLFMLNRTTRIRASTRSIDPGYYSFGAPFLRTNLLRYALLAEQRLFNNQVTASVDFRNDSNHQLMQDLPEVNMLSVVASLQLRFRKLPYLSLSFADYDQTFGGNANSTQTFAMSTGYNYSLAKLGMATSVTYNTSRNENPEALSLFIMNQYVLTQSVYFNFPLSLTGSVTYMVLEFMQQENNMLGGDFSASATLFQKVNATLGFNFYNAQVQDDRTGLFAEIRYPFLGYFSFNLRYDNNYYRHNLFPGGRMNEMLVRTSLQMNW